MRIMKIQVTGDEAKALAHTFAVWIRTVRGDESINGFNTDRSKEDGTVYREFWHPYPKEPVAELVASGYLFWGNEKVTVGVTRRGLSALKATPQFAQIKDEFPEEDIAAAEHQLKR